MQISYVSKLILVALTLVLSFYGCDSGANFRGSALPADLRGADFSLTDQHGRRFTLSEQRGKVVLLFFGFTYCPDVCPLTLSTWKKVQAALGDQADNVEFVYVTVDPERDSREKLTEHLAIFSPDFIGLRGPIEELQEVYADYGIYREKEQISEGASGYVINHTSSILFIDRQGFWRLNHSHNAAVEDIVHDIRLLKE